MLLRSSIEQSYQKECRRCGEVLKGRPDKKFCSDYCRNTFNNKLKIPPNNKVRNINNALSKNRRILKSLLSSGNQTIKVQREKLIGLGFQFKYLTHYLVTRSGKPCFYCYDHGWLPLGKDRVLIVRMENNG